MGSKTRGVPGWSQRQFRREPGTPLKPGNMEDSGSRTNSKRRWRKAWRVPLLPRESKPRVESNQYRMSECFVTLCLDLVHLTWFIFPTSILKLGSQPKLIIYNLHYQ